MRNGRGVGGGGEVQTGQSSPLVALKVVSGTATLQSALAL